MDEKEAKGIRDQIIGLIDKLYPPDSMWTHGMNMSGPVFDGTFVRRSAVLEVMNHISEHVYSEGDWK